MLNPDMLGVLYLTIFRLAVIAAGTVSIFYGYRLFLAGVFGQSSGKSPTEVSARLGSAQMSLKSAAPGTCFAGFGAFIIVAMMLSAPPQFTRTSTTTTSPGGQSKETDIVTMRGQGNGLSELIEEAKRAEKSGDKIAAMKGYESALRIVAEPLNNLAFLYHDAGRNKEALPLAQLAAQFAPGEAEFVDTLNRIQKDMSK